MSDLAALQRWFASVITHPDDVTSALADNPQLTAASVTLPSARLNVQQRLGIYHSAYRWRLVECLADDYPALQHALGAARFRALCLDYIAEHPARAPTLNAFGAHLPEFCARADLPQAECCAELARLEWAIVEVIHAADGCALGPDALSSLSPEHFGSARFEPSPAARLLELQFPVNGYYSAFRQHQAGALPAAESCQTLVRRRAATVSREDLAAPRAKLLAALLDRQPVAAALESAAQSGMAPEQVGQAFQHFLSLGLFVGLGAVPK